MEIASKARDRCVVIVHHGETKADHQNESHEVGEVESAAMLSGSKRCLDPAPDNQNCGPSPEKVLAHSIENPNVLLNERIDCSKGRIEEIVCRCAWRWPWSPSRFTSPAARHRTRCASSQGLRERPFSGIPVRIAWL